ncbi:type II secretion system protein [Clostridium niameyense]|uniref:Type II secretion system protein n=1 Tax=Clostridium niameyense TaxID=1622073 RepID=A0A6M0R970_9CLOT|nr:type II secretion system protein [Clostridium niameyense]NEZ46327.1 type II secretion system protein [Clostridium niameyense]
MFKLKSKKGFVIVEVLCGISIFMILFYPSLHGIYTSLKIKKQQIPLEVYFTYLESLKNNLIYNNTYEELKFLQENNKIYIKDEKIQEKILKSKDIKNIFTDEVPLTFPYIKMDVLGDEILEVNLQLNYKFNEKNKKIDCKFYKGRYKR